MNTVLAPGAGGQTRADTARAWRRDVTRPLADLAAALGIVVSSQPGFLSSLGDGFAAAFPIRAS